MMPDSTQQYRKLFVFTGIGFLVLIVGLIVWYIATHGSISVQNMTGDKLSLVAINGIAADATEVANNSTVSSGTYTVRNDVDGKFRIATITVPGWLQPAKITFDTPTDHSIERVAALTSGTLVGETGSLQSYDDGQSVITEVVSHPADDAFGLGVSTLELSKQLSQPKLLNGTSLVGFSTGDESDAEGFDQLVRYDSLNNSYTKLISDSFKTRDPVLITSQSLGGDGVLVFDATDKTYTYYKNGTSKKISLQTPAAFSDTMPIVDINGDSLAVLSGDNYTPASSDEGAPVAQKDSTVTLYSLSTGQKTDSFGVGRSNSISQITVSGDGSVAVIDHDLLNVYTKSGALIIQNSFSPTSQVFWQDNTNLYAVSDDSNITHLDTQKRQLVSVFGSGSLSVSNAHLWKNKLYFTSFTDRNKVAELPDGYVVDLSKQVNNKNLETVINKLPMSDNDYQINVIGTTIYIELATTKRDGSDPVLYAQEAADKEARARGALEAALGKDVMGSFTIRVTTTN